MQPLESYRQWSPQGSVLGPLFVIIFINDQLKLLSTPSLTYADDIKLISVNNSLNQSKILQNDLDITHYWSQSLATVPQCKEM